MDDTYECYPVVTLRTTPYVDTRPVLFTCAICERGIYAAMWRSDGRSRPLPPICTSCEQAYGGTNLSSWRGPRMDARIARQVNAAASFLKCLAYRTQHEGKRRGA